VYTEFAGSYTYLIKNVFLFVCLINVVGVFGRIDNLAT
jgi:hypothetical protein